MPASGFPPGPPAGTDIHQCQREQMPAIRHLHTRTLPAVSLGAWSAIPGHHHSYPVHRKREVAALFNTRIPRLKHKRLSAPKRFFLLLV